MSDAGNGGAGTKKGSAVFKIGLALGAVALALVLISAMLFVVFIDGLASADRAWGTYALAVPTTLESRQHRFCRGPSA